MSTISAQVTRIMNNVRIHTPGAIDANIQLEMFNVLDEFLRSTNIWQDSVPFDTVVGEVNYSVDSSEHASILRLMSLVDGNNFPVGATMATPGELVLGDIPSIMGTLTAVFSLTVVDTVDRNGYPTCPSWIFEKYNAAIIDGVVGRMMAQPAKPYSNERLGIFHTRTFRSALDTARSEAARMNLYGAQAWRFPQTFIGRRR